MSPSTEQKGRRSVGMSTAEGMLAVLATGVTGAVLAALAVPLLRRTAGGGAVSPEGLYAVAAGRFGSVPGWRVYSCCEDVLEDPDAHGVQMLDVGPQQAFANALDGVGRLLGRIEAWRGCAAHFAPETLAQLEALRAVRVLPEELMHTAADLPSGPAAGRYLVVDLAAWHAAEVAGSSLPTHEEAARAILTAVERLTSAGDCVVVCIRMGPSVGLLQSVLPLVVDPLKANYGGSMLQLWALNCGLTARLAFGFVGDLVKHAEVRVLSPEDVRQGKCDGKSLSPGDCALLEAVFQLP